MLELPDGILPLLACRPAGVAVYSVAMTWKPWQFLAVAIAGWMNRQQQDAIAYLRTENRILREKLGPGRIILDNAQKCRLALASL